MKKNLNQLNQHIDVMCKEFIKKYFGEGYTHEDDDYWFVSQDKPGVLRETLYINDFYFGISDVYLALWYNIKEEDLFTRYEQSTDPDNKYSINLYSWLVGKGYFKK